MNAAALLFALSLSPASPACEPDVERALDRLERSLVQLEKEIDDVGARAVRKRLERKLEDARRATEHVRSESCRAVAHPSRPSRPRPPGPPPHAVPPPPPPMPALLPPLSEATFRGLQAAIQAESFSDDKVNVLESGVTGQCVTVRQTKTLLGLFSFSANRTRAAQLLVPRLTDRERAFELFSAMTFQKDKDELKRVIDTVPPEPACWAG